MREHMFEKKNFNFKKQSGFCFFKSANENFYVELSLSLIEPFKDKILNFINNLKY